MSEQIPLSAAAVAAPDAETRQAAPDVFLSYAREDANFVRALHRHLTSQGRSVWVDWQSIPHSAEWWAEIERGIESSAAFIFVLSPESVSSQICARELAHAEASHARIIPIVRRDVDDEPVPKSLADRNWLFFRETDDDRGAYVALSKAIDTDLEEERLHARLRTRAAEWESGGRKRSGLLRGDDLKMAEQWTSSSASRVRPREKQYVLASRRAVEQFQRRTIGAVATALVVTIGLSIVTLFLRQEAVQQRNRAEEQARQALARQLAAQAVAERDRQIDLALLLAVQSLNVQDTAEGRSSLLQTLISASGLTRTFRTGGGPATQVAFSPVGSTLAFGDSEGNVTVGGLRGDDGFGLDAGNSPITALAFSADGALLASGHGDGTVSVWDVRIGERRFSARMLQGISDLAFDPTVQTLAGAAEDGPVVLWDLEDGDRTVLEGAFSANHLAFNSDGRALLAGHGAGYLYRWILLDNQTELDSWSVGLGMPYAGTFSADMARFAGIVIGSSTPYVNSTEEDVSTQSAVFLKGSTNADAIALDANGTQLAIAGEGRIKLWNVKAGEKDPDDLGGYRGEAEALAFSPDGGLVALASSSGEVVVWSRNATSALVRTLRQASSYPTAARGVATAAFSPDGRWLAWSVVSLDEQSVIVWDLKRDREKVRLPGGAVIWLNFSPDGNSLATRAEREDGPLMVWQVENGVGRKVSDVPWDPAPGSDEAQGPPPAVPWEVKGPSGLGASLQADGTLVLFETARRLPLGFIQVEEAADLSDLTFSPDGKLLAVASPGGGLALVDLSIDSWQRQACALAGRNLTTEEWRLYVGETAMEPTCRMAG